MATLEERVAFLEGRVGEHSQMLEGIRGAIVNLEQRMDRRFEAVDRRFESLEHRLAAFEQKVDQRFAAIDQRFVQVDQKLDQRTDALDAKMSRQFIWLVGVQVTTLVAIVAALLAR